MGKFSVIDNNILDKQGILNLLKQFIFGNSDIELYDQDKVYKFGDKSYIIDTLTGDINVITATSDNVTGEYDPTKWNNITLADTVGGGTDKVVVISEYRPRDRVTKLWLTPDEFSSHYIAIPGYKPGTDDPEYPPIDPDDPSVDPNTEGIILLFTTNDIPIVDDTNTADLSHIETGEIVFDIEGEGVMSVHGLTNIQGKNEFVIDEQEDIHVNANEPDTDKYAILWIDTDLSDDIW